MVDLPRIHHRLQPRATFSRALHRQQQREQPFAVRRAGVFAQRLAERQVLRFRMRRKASRVGREKGERRRLVAAVFGEIEMHAADEIPRGIPALEELLDGKPRLAEFRTERALELAPQIAQDGGAQILRAGDRRRGGREGLQFLRRRRARMHLRTKRLCIRQRADRVHIARAEFAPVAENGRQGGGDLFRAELQQSVTGAAREGIVESSRDSRVERRSVLRGRKGQMAVRRQGRGKRMSFALHGYAAANRGRLCKGLPRTSR